jgi:hypothetical protein
MFCPQCGQQQVPGEMRFCSRCGFPLAGVTTLISTGGALPTVQQESGVLRTPKQEGVRQGVILILLGMVLVPLVALFATQVIFAPEILIPPVAIICFVGGLMRIIYALAFQEGAPRLDPNYMPPYGTAAAPSASLGAGARNAALPPAQSVPVPNWRTNTAEIVRPLSVTENTTRLLRDEAEPPQR